MIDSGFREVIGETRGDCSTLRVQVPVEVFVYDCNRQRQTSKMPLGNTAQSTSLFTRATPSLDEFSCSMGQYKSIHV